MRSLFWSALVLSVLANAYVNTFAGWNGSTHIVASAGTGTVVLGSAVALWLTRPRAEN
ncbi:hypothetical protein [Streptomyces sp. NPDC094049]|uniref:hypothetical protein n=1 Tax=Streptomyces sp. NPDC094049 TaxID=3154987 RepID=UPI00332E54AE